MAVDHEPKTFLTSLFAAAVAAADPYEAIKANLPERPKGRTIVIGAGKASGEMARAFEALWDGPLKASWSPGADHMLLATGSRSSRPVIPFRMSRA